MDAAGNRLPGVTAVQSGAEAVVTIDTGAAPDDPITREQMAAILYRYAGSPESAGMVLSEFTDAERISPYAMNAMRWAVGTGLINGKGGGVVDPQGSATRAEAAAILRRFCENAAR